MKDGVSYAMATEINGSYTLSGGFVKNNIYHPSQWPSKNCA